MSDTDRDREDGFEEDERGSEAVRNLLKRSLSIEALVKHPPHLLPGVQRRIRKRSHGKFFADGWSPAHSRVSYILAGLLTLALAVLAFLALGPWGLR